MKRIFNQILLAILLVPFAQAQYIPKSSVHIANPNEQANRDKYSITNIAWGFLPFGNLEKEDKMIEYIDKVHQIHSENRVYHARIEFDASWKNFINYCELTDVAYEDHACLDLEGDIFEYDWFVGRSYNDGYPYWISSHSPVFKDFLKYQVDKQFEADKVEVLMIDAQTSSTLVSYPWSNGDFSVHCMEAFTQHLIANGYTAEELEVENIEDFDYKVYLNDKGHTRRGSYKQSLPLIDEYRLFQNQAIAKLIDEIAQYAKAKENAAEDMIVGISSPIIDVYRATFSDEVSFYQEELPMHETGNYPAPILTYKFSENIGTEMVVTADPGDWKDAYQGYTSDEEVKTWIADGYANGANYIAPVLQWAYGSDWWSPSVDMTYIFHMIQSKKELFDGYEPLKSDIAAIWSLDAAKSRPTNTNNLALALKENNIYYNLVVAGNEYYNDPLEIERLSDYEKIIIPENVYIDYLSLNEEWKAALENLEGKVIYWNDNTDLATIKSSLTNTVSVAIDGANEDQNITVSPRTNDEGLLTLHLINRDYDTSSDTYLPKSNIDIELKGDLINTDYGMAFVHQPGRNSYQIDIENTDNTYTVSTDEALDIWSIIELIPTEAIVALDDISLDHSEIALDGQSGQVNVIYSPTNASNKTVTWTSDDETVATVINGKITPISIGTTTIHVTSVEGNYTAATSVTVNSLIKVEQINLSPDQLTIDIGETNEFTLDVAPADAANQQVTWSIDNESIASIDENGRITGLSKGTTKVYASSTDGSNIVTIGYLLVEGAILDVDFEQITNNKIRIYPNPAKGILNIKGINGPVQITIYNVQGHVFKIQQTDSNSTMSIPVHKLTTGMYLLQIKDNQGIDVRKFSIVK
ncbi:MAG: Ig-like domain-containing protein [Reichenbachiella sp.]